MKRSTLIILISVILIGYFGYKEFWIYKYSDVNSKEIRENFVNGLKNKTEDISISSVSAENYLTYKNISIRNDFSDFEQKKDNLYVKDNRSFKLGEDKPFLKQIENLDSKVKKIIKKKKINNDLELLDFIANNYSEFNLLTLMEKVDEEVAINKITDIISTDINSYTLIKGAYTGYMFTNDKTNLKTVYILTENTRYYLSFQGFNDNDIKDLLNTLKIN